METIVAILLGVLCIYGISHHHQPLLKSWEEKLVESYFKYHTGCEPGHCPVMDAYDELTA